MVIITTEVMMSPTIGPGNCESSMAPALARNVSSALLVCRPLRGRTAARQFPVGPSVEGSRDDGVALSSAALV
ncbi:hypothetical protein GWI33_004938 [Rhynchophorus ferrugineus]|uniref:Uncharacterized protein n=1 Tax=Rhynchophorus ferrugineus TaxID=354439 RepID=A0A834IUA7_RHYFE|nr:hypothetical protein GWI33_004938 [Rhynchophorus ferrugineus]